MPLSDSREKEKRVLEADSLLVVLGSVRHAVASSVAHERHPAATRLEQIQDRLSDRRH